MRQYSTSNKRSSSAHSGSLNRSQTPKMDSNHLNPNNATAILTNEKTTYDDVKVEINQKDDTNVATSFANDMLASPNFLHIPLKPIEKPLIDDPNNGKP